MPLYRCNIPTGSLAAEHKEQIAKAITEVHCDVTGAPESFVHVFFFEEDEPADAMHKVRGTIRAGRTDAHKQAIWDRITDAYSTIAHLPAERISVKTADIPSAWNMEGGRVLPEPGQEAEWLEAHSESANS